MENASDQTLVNADLDGKDLLVVTVSVLLVRTWQLHAIARGKSVNPSLTPQPGWRIEN